MIKKGKKKQDRVADYRIAEHTHLEISEDFDEEEAKGIMKDVLCDMVENAIEESKQRNKLDTSVGIILSADSYGAWIRLEKNLKLDCDYGQCKSRGIIQSCYLKDFKNCHHYSAKTKKDTSPYRVGAKISLNTR